MVATTTPYLIIGGTTKAATTSVFDYLSGHPQVARSKEKEMRFFLDQNYPLEKRVQFGTILDYNKNFENYSISKVCLEATPDYLYCASSVDKMNEVLKDFKLVFILRDPTTRLQSWWKFAKQNNSINADMPLEEYFMMQQGQSQDDKPQYLMTLEQGFYSKFLKVFFEKLAISQMHIMFYEDIARDPKKELQSLSDFIGIEKSYFNNFKFKISNQTMELKNPKIHAKVKVARKKVRDLLSNSFYSKKILRKIYRLLVEPIYLLLNKSTEFSTNTEYEVVKEIRKYYENEKNDIFKITGKMPPWQ